MGRKKKRSKKKGYVFVPEGQDEENLLLKFKELYPVDTQKVNVNILEPAGGNPSSIIKEACLAKDKADYVYVLLDNDKPLEKYNEQLWNAWAIGGTELEGMLPKEVSELNKKKKKPMLIVSLPVAFENTILDLFSIPTTSTKTSNLKKEVASNFGKDFVSHIDRKMLENCNNPVIKTLVSLFQKMEKM